MSTAEVDLRGRLQGLADLLPLLESTSDDEFGVWIKSEEREPGVWSMPYVDYGSVADEFRSAAGKHGWIRADIDWPLWARTDQARELVRDPALIASASADDLARLLTTIIRGDRFHEGNLLGAFSRGHLVAIARRARALALE